MDNSMTIIIVSRDELKELQICIEAIRRFNAVDNLKIVVIDNSSEDDTKNWLSTQDDISYATVEECGKGYAEVLNTAIDLFGIEGNILFMQPQYAMTPNCMLRLHNGLYLKSSIGAVAPVSNVFNFFSEEDQIADFSQAILLSDCKDEIEIKRACETYEGVVYISAEARTVVGKFDEKFNTPASVMTDYMLRMVELGLSFYYVVNAITYNMIYNKRMHKSIIIITGENAILKYNSDQIKKAYLEDEYKVYELSAEYIVENPDEFIKIIQRGVDAAFVFNNRGWLLTIGGKNLWDLYEIPCINYILDHPFYYFDTLDKAPLNGIVACVDRKHVEYINRYNKNVIRSIFIPLGGEDVSGGMSKLIKNRKKDVLFVGNYKKREEFKEFNTFQNLVIAEMLSHTEKTLEQVIEEQYKVKKPYADDSEIKKVIEKNRIIDMYLKNYFRSNVVKILVNNGIHVDVYGAGWEEADFYNNSHFKFHGSVLQEECLNQMLDSKIVLNIMPWFKDGIHDRVINSMLAGAVCVTDGSQYLKEEFEEDKEYIGFHLNHMEMLPSMINELLDDTDRMQSICDTVYEKARKHHIWSRRMKNILNIAIDGL